MFPGEASNLASLIVKSVHTADSFAYFFDLVA